MGIPKTAKPTTSIKKIKELLAVLDPYAESWQEWTASGACFLSEQKITIIQNYLLSNSHFSSAIELNISPVTAASILNKAKWRLKWCYPKFQGWFTERLLEDHGIISYETELDRFLNSPFAYLEMPLELKRKLNILFSETMGEVLQTHTEFDLRTFKCIGEKTIEDFKNYLERNGCLYLLKYK